MTDVKPTRATIHPMIAWPLIFTLTVFIGAWLYTLGGRETFSPWWLGLVGLVVAWAGADRADAVWSVDQYGTRQNDGGRTLAWAAGVASGAWLVYAGHVGPGRAAAIWALVGLVGSVIFWALMWRAPKRAAAQAARRAKGQAAFQDRQWREILDAADCADVIITGRTEHRAGIVLTCEPDPRADKHPTYADFAARSPRIATQAAMAIRKSTGTRLPRNAVRAEEGADDAEFLLNVSMRDVFAEAISYVPDYTPGDITNALDVGEYEDASRILLTVLDGHMKIVGMTGSGKSVVANNLIARITACSNALVWVCATDKLIPLIFPWLRSWFDGSAVAPMLDYVAGKSAHSVLIMLRDAYKLCCDRNDRLADESKMRATSREPATFVLVEETSHAVEFQDTIGTHDGQDVTISDLLKMIAQAGRSANVRIILLSQYGLNSGLGERASELMRNLTIRICLKTTEPYDGYRTLPGLPSTVDTTSIPAHTMYVQPSIEVSRAVPGKAPVLDGTEMISPIATRQAAWRPAGVEPESDLGQDYARRWDQLRHVELAGAVRRQGLTWRTPGAPVVGVATHDAAAGEDVEITLGDTEGETDVDTAEGWTAADDEAWQALLGGGQDPPKPFDVPDSGPGVARLRRLADQIGQSGPPGPAQTGPPEPDRSDAYPPGRELPEPLATVLVWLDAMEAGAVMAVPGSADTVHVRSDADWYMTETIAMGIGWGADRTADLGRELSRFGLRSGNVPRSVDPARRKGYRVTDIREAATRWRFGM